MPFVANNWDSPAVSRPFLAARPGVSRPRRSRPPSLLSVLLFHGLSLPRPGRLGLTSQTGALCPVLSIVFWVFALYWANTQYSLQVAPAWQYYVDLLLPLMLLAVLAGFVAGSGVAVAAVSLFLAGELTGWSLRQLPQIDLWHAFKDYFYLAAVAWLAGASYTRVPGRFSLSGALPWAAVIFLLYFCYEIFLHFHARGAFTLEALKNAMTLPRLLSVALNAACAAISAKIYYVLLAAVLRR